MNNGAGKCGAARLWFLTPLMKIIVICHKFSIDLIYFSFNLLFALSPRLDSVQSFIHKQSHLLIHNKFFFNYSFVMECTKKNIIECRIIELLQFLFCSLFSILHNLPIFSNGHLFRLFRNATCIILCEYRFVFGINITSPAFER